MIFVPTPIRQRQMKIGKPQSKTNDTLRATEALGLPSYGTRGKPLVLLSHLLTTAEFGRYLAPQASKNGNSLTRKNTLLSERKKNLFKRKQYGIVMKQNYTFVGKVYQGTILTN